MSRMIRLSEFAKRNGMTYKTAHNYFKKGLIKGIQPSGIEKTMILVDENQFRQVEETAEESPNFKIDELALTDIPKGNSTLENLEACVKLSKYLIFDELNKDEPNKNTIVSSLRTLLQSTKYMLDMGVEDDQETQEELLLETEG